MLGIKTYKDLQLEKEIIKDRIEQLKQNQKLLSKELRGPVDITGIDYSKDKGAGIAPRPLEDVLAEMMQIDSMIFLEERKLKNAEGTIESIDNKLRQLEGLHYKVAYLKEIQRKPLRQIADELGYSLDYIKEISAKIK